MARGSIIASAIQATAYRANAATNERLATPIPTWRRMRLTIVDTTAIPAIRPTTAPTTRSEALVVTGSRHARQLADTMTLLKDRPAHAIPNNPTIVAIQPVVSGCVNAVLIWSAIVPVKPPASLMSRGSTHRGEEAEHADDEERERHEEQEQAERERTADDRPSSLPVALVDPQTHVQ